MTTVTSKDGTRIGYEQSGQGAPVILVDGAFCFRQFGPMPGLAALLAPHFTVFMYDRRGRGESSDRQPFAVEREIEDLDALIQAAGGAAFVFGTSSGGALAMETALKLGSKVKKLAMYEAPYYDDAAARQDWKTYRQQLNEALAAGRRGDAVVLFMKLVGSPDEMVNGMKQAPVWSAFEAVAPTLAYDAAVLGEDRSAPVGRAAQVTVPALVMDGGASFPFMHDTAVALANAMPKGTQRTLDGQTHDVNVAVLAPVLVEFFGG